VAVPCTIVGFGAVGKLLYRLVKERELPVEQPRVFARTERTEVLDGDEIQVGTVSEEAFPEGGVALFAGSEGVGNVSEQWGRVAAQRGCTVIDNSSTFRMEPDVPLVVPEVNPHALGPDTRLIANPNCSTIQMVVAIAPIHRAAGIERIVVSTYQSTSGAGGYAAEIMWDEARAVLDGKPGKHDDSPFAQQIAFNCVPLIGGPDQTGYTSEERKMIHETRKILGDDSIGVSATTVRVGVEVGHAECVNLQLKQPLSAQEARELLDRAPGVVVLDDWAAPERTPTPLDSAGRDDVLVGRLREDESVEFGLDMWVVADNLRKGAATNAVQIAEALFSKGYLGG
jgi:aspartate-semialdehyde dehydrogenase